MGGKLCINVGLPLFEKKIEYEKWIKKWDLSIVYRAMLVILDILFINVSSFIALWVRFNMQIK